MAINWDEAVLVPLMAAFGEEVTYRPRSHPAFTITDGVFDAQYGVVEVDNATGAQTTSRTPALGVREVLFAHPPRQNDLVDVPSERSQYVVVNVQPDSHGHLLLILSRKGAL